MRRTTTILIGLLVLSTVVPMSAEGGRRSRRRCYVPCCPEWCYPCPPCEVCPAPAPSGAWYCRSKELFSGSMMYSGSRFNEDDCTKPFAVFCTGSNCGVEKKCLTKPSTNCDSLAFIAAPAPGALSAPAGSGDYYHAKARHYVSKHAKLAAALKNDDVDEGLKKLDPEFEVVFDGYVETPAINLRLIKICRKGFINSSNIGVEVTGAGPAGLKTVTLAKGDVHIAGAGGVGLGSVRVVTFKGIEQLNLDTDDVFVALTK